MSNKQNLFLLVYAVSTDPYSRPIEIDTADTTDDANGTDVFIWYRWGDNDNMVVWSHFESSQSATTEEARSAETCRF